MRQRTRSVRSTSRWNAAALAVSGLVGLSVILGASSASADTPESKRGAPANINPDKAPVLDPAKITLEPMVALTEAQKRAQADGWVAEDPTERVACVTGRGSVAGLAELDRVTPGALSAAAATRVCAKEWSGSRSAPATVTTLSHSLGHHWAHNGLAHSQIYFVDHTGSRWPITTVTYKWNEAHGVDSYYESSCPSSRLHCVNVYEYNSDDGNYGVTYFPNGWDGAGHNYEGVYVRLNNHTATTATQTRKSSCHELGHVLGLAHRATNASCLTQGAAPPISTTPDTHDFDELHAIYNHGN